jgi:pimeloyl-ACP methyl ester carboxylesterase
MKRLASSGIFGAAHQSTISYGLITLLVVASGCRTMYPDVAATPYPSGLRSTHELASLKRIHWTGFSTPGEMESRTGLYAVTPYYRGKIPVVLVHGLLSEPQTWDHMLKKLRHQPNIDANFQFWVFMYPTGNSYLQSAAELRANLNETLLQVDPDQRDGALRRMVLVGHSMGGLLSKLQVTHSDQTLWRTVSDRSIDEFEVDDDTRTKMEHALFFAPQPFVERVVYIGTPHRGSTVSQSTVGWLGNKLVRFPRTLEQNYQQLVQANLSLLRTDSVSHIPTSIDHLAPDDPILLATQQLPVSEHVKQHSIIGSGHRLPDGTDGDGVVSFASAQLAGVESELILPAEHSELHKDVRTIYEVERILMEHLAGVRR